MAQKRKNKLESLRENSDSKKRKSIQDEEPAFARGGASVLTALENKQIQIRAKQDVLFEAATGKHAIQASSDDGENVQEDRNSLSGKAVKSRERIKRTKSKRISEKVEEDHKIDGLSPRRLIAGQIILGVISQINRYDISVCLPNNITGYIPLTAISEGITKRLEQIADQASESGSDFEEPLDINLHNLFYIGQFVRVVVISTVSSREDKKQKRHIELSVKPQQANLGLDPASITINTTVQAEIVSIEDNGYVMNLGLDGLKGFMPLKELDPSINVKQLQLGGIVLCMVTGKGSNGRIMKLSSNPQNIGNLEKGNLMTEASSVDSFLPGTAVEVLVTDVTSSGIAGKVFGVLDATSDFIHSGAGIDFKSLEVRFPVGKRVKGRIICNFPASDNKKVGVSFLEHIVSMQCQMLDLDRGRRQPTQVFPLSTIVDEARVVRINPGRGVFVDLGENGAHCFTHISRLSDEKVASISESSGPYKLGTCHRCRIVGFNSMDGLLFGSMEQTVLSLPFLRLADLSEGQVIEGKINRLEYKDKLVVGALIDITEDIIGFVPEIHLSDIRLQHPERKLREGSTISARVLSIDLERRKLRLTLKKTLINSDSSPWTSYDNLVPGLKSPGTLINVMSSGAVVQFYGEVRAFLPVSQMSESYLADPKKHFRIGQVVNVHIVNIDREEKKMTVSCRDYAFIEERQEALKALYVGQNVPCLVAEKLVDKIVVEIGETALKGVISVNHLTDSDSKSQAFATRIRVGQKLQDTVILSKDEVQCNVHLTSRPSLIEAFASQSIPTSFEEVQQGRKVVGFVRNIIESGVFVQFANEVVGLLPKNHVSEATASLPGFGLKRQETISATVLSVDIGQKRFLLSQRPLLQSMPKVNRTTLLSDVVDGVSSSLDDFSLGKITKAKVVSVKETQLNVQLAANVQGRIDVSEIFDEWNEIKDRKRPLSQYTPNTTLDVRILGVHDSRTHKFLPITHTGKAPVFELSAKRSVLERKDIEPLSLDKVDVGSTRLCYINNIADDCAWVNISPNVRGRIRLIDLANDIALLSDTAKNFPRGAAVRAKVTRVENGQLDLSARIGSTKDSVVIENLSPGMVLPSMVTKISERQIMVSLGDQLAAPVHLINLSDDFDQADPSCYHKNQIVRVCILKIDVTNKKILLSARPSKVLSSSLPVVDREISDVSQLNVNDIVRGFVKSVSDQGIFVTLGGDVDAFVRISELSNAFIRDWKSEFEIDQLVKGKVISVDQQLKKVQLSLKQSVIDSNYKEPLKYTDLYKGQIVTGKVRKLEDFGVFIALDNSANVSGLCHRSEMADHSLPDVRKLYSVGDHVKAIVLKVDLEKRRVSFGLKASYFEDQDNTSEVEESVDGGVVIGSNGLNHEGALDSDAKLDDIEPVKTYRESISGLETENRISAFGNNSDTEGEGDALDAGAFNWTGSIFEGKNNVISSSDTENENPFQTKKRKSRIQTDMTASLDAGGPQSAAQFEKLLMTHPNSSSLWVKYLAFQLEVGEVEKARDIADRATKSFSNHNHDAMEESLNVWTAYLNLENTYGTDEGIEDVFKRACERNDPEEIHQRLASIYIQSGKNEKADIILEKILKSYSQNYKNWINYASFLFKTGNVDRGRALLPRASIALPQEPRLLLQTTMKFGQLEFRSEAGDAERGRTIFEGLISSFPRRTDLLNVLLDLEIGMGDREQIRRLFERITTSKLKKHKVKAFFKKWLEYEQEHGDLKIYEKVKAKASEHMRQTSDT